MNSNVDVQLSVLKSLSDNQYRLLTSEHRISYRHRARGNRQQTAGILKYADSKWSIVNI
jgi:hypothetical protein